MLCRPARVGRANGGSRIHSGNLDGLGSRGNLATKSGDLLRNRVLAGEFLLQPLGLASKPLVFGGLFSGTLLNLGEFVQHGGHSGGPVLKLRELSGHPWRSVVCGDSPCLPFTLRHECLSDSLLVCIYKGPAADVVRRHDGLCLVVARRALQVPHLAVFAKLVARACSDTAFATLGAAITRSCHA